MFQTTLITTLAHGMGIFVATHALFTALFGLKRFKELKNYRNVRILRVMIRRLFRIETWQYSLVTFTFIATYFLAKNWLLPYVGMQ